MLEPSAKVVDLQWQGGTGRCEEIDQHQTARRQEHIFISSGLQIIHGDQMKKSHRLNTDTEPGKRDGKIRTGTR